jgi:hypothetical protein
MITGQGRNARRSFLLQMSGRVGQPNDQAMTERDATLAPLARASRCHSGQRPLKQPTAAVRRLSVQFGGGALLAPLSHPTLVLHGDHLFALDDQLPVRQRAAILCRAPVGEAAKLVGGAAAFDPHELVTFRRGIRRRRVVSTSASVASSQASISGDTGPRWANARDTRFHRPPRPGRRGKPDRRHPAAKPASHGQRLGPVPDGHPYLLAGPGTPRH